MLFRSVTLVLVGMDRMSMRQMRVVGCLFVLAFFMMLGGCFVMTGRVRVVFCCTLMMSCCFFRHGVTLLRRLLLGNSVQVWIEREWSRWTLEEVVNAAKTLGHGSNPFHQRGLED